MAWWRGLQRLFAIRICASRHRSFVEGLAHPAKSAGVPPEAGSRPLPVRLSAILGNYNRCGLRLSTSSLQDRWVNVGDAVETTHRPIILLLGPSDAPELSEIVALCHDFSAQLSGSQLCCRLLKHQLQRSGVGGEVLQSSARFHASSTPSASR